MNLSRFALRNLRRRPFRTTLTILSMAMAVAVLYSLLMFNSGYQNALKSQLQQMGVHLMVVPIGCPYEAASLVLKGGKITSFLSADIVDKISALPEVQIAAPQLMQAIVRPEEGRTDIYLGVDERTFRLKNWWRLNGSAEVVPETLLAKPNAIVMGASAALIERRENIGEALWIPEIEAEFALTGILEPTGSQDDGFFYIPLKTAQEKFKHHAQVTAVQIRLVDPSKAPEVGDQLEKLFPGAQVVRMEELLGSIASLMASAQALIFAIVLVVIVISAVGVLNTMLMSVFERIHEIGILRATGAGRADIFALIWTETLFMSVIGGITGLLIAGTIAPIVDRILHRFVPMVSGQTILEFDGRSALLCVLTILGVALAAGAYPALRAATGRTIEALRTE